jgi:hypothetical protein
VLAKGPAGASSVPGGEQGSCVEHLCPESWTHAAVAKLENCGMLCGMGNKDKGRREVKKPKKQVPKPEPSRPAVTFVDKPTGPS